MSSIFVTVSGTGRTLFGSLQQITATGTPGDYWDVTAGQWASVVAINDRKIVLTEGGVNDLGRYTGGTGALGAYTGYALKQIHDDNLADLVIGTSIVYIANGIEQREAIASDLSNLPSDIHTYINANGGVTSSNMRGTDAAMLAASYTAPDNASIVAAAADAATAKAQATTAATQSTAAAVSAASVDGKLTTGRATNLDKLDALISSRSSHDAAAVLTYINANGGVVANNMRGTDAAMLATSYVAPNNAGITTAAADATAAKIAAQATDAKLTSARAGYLDNLSGGPVATQATVQAITNTTRLKVVAAGEAQIPSTGTNSYTVDVFLYDTAGNMEAPDATPTITAANALGTDRTGNVSAVSNVSTGHYRATYTVGTGHVAETIVLSVSAVENGLTLKGSFVMPVVSEASAGGGGFTTSDRAWLQSVFNKLPTKAYLTGTAAADGDIDLDAADGDRNQFKADIALLALEATAAAIPAAVQAYINANGGVASNNMRGTDLALLATGYTAPDNVNIGIAATQATTAASQATAAASDALAAKTAAQTVDGKLTVARAANLDKIDVVLSTRSAFDYTINPVLLAAGHGLAIATDQLAIKAKTDLIPTQPAAVGDVPTASQIAIQVESTLGAAHGAGAWDATSDATLAMQNAIIAAVGVALPSPPSSTQQVVAQRTWVLDSGGEDTLAPSVIILPQGADVVLAMEFTKHLNPGTGIAVVADVTDLSGNALVPTGLAPSQDRQQAHFSVTGLVSGLEYELRVTVTTSDGQTLTGRGILICE